MIDKIRSPELWLPAALLLILFMMVLLLRPVLPPDETRYMAVAWEMYLRGDWLAPLTVNFQPYHHKPPLLFWLINASWSVFGVSRWAATIPVLLASLAFIYLTRALAISLFPSLVKVHRSITFLVIGSFPFVVYSLVLMFDVTLTVFVLLSLLALLNYARTGRRHHLAWFALFVGLGVLTKGPVAWLYVLFPILFWPWWKSEDMPRRKWYGGCSVALLISTIPVLLWLVPVLSQASGNFAYWLIWQQTAGRVSGDFNSAHVRPVWFFLPFIPVFLLPWILLPAFWKGLKSITEGYRQDRSVRFLVLWILPVLVVFSLIKGAKHLFNHSSVLSL